MKVSFRLLPRLAAAERIVLQVIKSSRATVPGKTVVLLGAGSSVEAGLSTSARLTQDIYEDLSSSRSTSDYARLLAYLISRLQARNAAQGLSPYKQIEVEELFDALNLVIKRDTLLVSQFVERWDRGFESFDQGLDESAFKRSLAEIINKHISSAINNRRAAFLDSDYRKLIAALKPRSVLSAGERDLSRTQQPFFSSLVSHLSVAPGASSYLGPLCTSEMVTTIATLNYDLALETCCDALGVDYDYGLSRWESQKRVEWPDNKKLRIMKLHGSLNWTGEPESFRIRKDEIQDFERRVLVFGGIENKLSANGPFLQFLYKLERSLLTTGSLLVVGYSFRDPHINALINRWILTRRSTRLVVVDPNPPPLAFVSGKQTRKVGEKAVSYHLQYKHLALPASVGIQRFFAEPDLFDAGI
ncbi:MAG TPA: SIR2 family protein [Sphingomonadaceae bacterium]|nr:SIR2 family protein [Sphingomonadaceae bacterium]